MISEGVDQHGHRSHEDHRPYGTAHHVSGVRGFGRVVVLHERLLQRTVDLPEQLRSHDLDKRHHDEKHRIATIIADLSIMRATPQALKRTHTSGAGPTGSVRAVPCALGSTEESSPLAMEPEIGSSGEVGGVRVRVHALVREAEDLPRRVAQDVGRGSRVGVPSQWLTSRRNDRSWRGRHGAHQLRFFTVSAPSGSRDMTP